MWKKRGTETDIPSVIERNTGISISDFINPPRNVYIKNLKEAATRIETAITNNESVTIYGDYDADGITGSTILYRTLTLLGHDKVNVILPKRFSEGYGLSLKAVSMIKDGLLITVDNGITAVDEIKAAKEKVLDVIIIDHHLLRDDGILPEANIIVDPKAIEGSDFSDYCGAGLAYKLAQIMIEDDFILKQLNSLAAIGTIADVMPLIHDNRNIVIDGLKFINERKVPIGLNILLDELDFLKTDEHDIAFKIAPIINASGRMRDDGAMLAFNLIAHDSDSLEVLAKNLININEERKNSVREGLELCEKKISEDCLFGDNPLVIYTTNAESNIFQEGIIGILAGKMAEKYKVSTFVLTESNGVLKGSGRSYGSVHLKNLLDEINNENKKTSYSIWRSCRCGRYFCFD